MAATKRKPGKPKPIKHAGDGTMNKAELAYLKEVLELRDDIPGKIRYEEIRFLLSPGDKASGRKPIHFTPDFVVETEECFEIHEVKESLFSFKEDAKLKWKLMKEHYPCFKFILAIGKLKRDGGGWDLRAT